MIHGTHREGEATPRVDLRQFPLYAKASPRVVTVAPGDTLYIPPNVWHWVKSGDGTVAINVWTEYAHLPHDEVTLLRGAASHWPAMQRWTPAFLREHMDLRSGFNGVYDRLVDRGMFFCDRTHHFYPEMGSNGTQQPVGSFAEWSRRAEGRAPGEQCFATVELPDDSSLLRTGTTMFRAAPRGAKEAVEELPPGVRVPDSTVNVWMSTGTAFSGMHYDETANSLTVLRGVKNVTLYDMADTPWLYPALPWTGTDARLRTEWIANMTLSGSDPGCAAECPSRIELPPGVVARSEDEVREREALAEEDPYEEEYSEETIYLDL